MPCVTRQCDNDNVLHNCACQCMLQGDTMHTHCPPCLEHASGQRKKYKMQWWRLYFSLGQHEQQKKAATLYVLSQEWHDLIDSGSGASWITCQTRISTVLLWKKELHANITRRKSGASVSQPGLIIQSLWESKSVCKFVYKLKYVNWESTLSLIQLFFDSQAHCTTVLKSLHRTVKCLAQISLVMRLQWMNKPSTSLTITLWQTKKLQKFAC